MGPILSPDQIVSSRGSKLIRDARIPGLRLLARFLHL
jgi:hypothetical protein